MRAFFPILALSLALVFSFSVEAEERFVYLSAGGGVTVFQVDLDSGKLSEIQQNSGAGLTAITRDQKHLYPTILTLRYRRRYHVRLH